MKMRKSLKGLRKSRSLLMLFLFFCVLSVSASAAFAQMQGLPKRMGNDIIPGHYIVVLRDHVQDPDFVAENIARYHRFTLGHVYKRALKGFSARIPGARLEAVARDPDVAFIEPDRWVYAVQQTIPTGVERMGTLQNPTAKIDGVDDRVNVDIAIIDTGIDLDHPDLNVVSSTNCARSVGACRDGQGNDGHGHGTHVAGIAAALDNNYGAVGVAPGARLWAVKVMSDNGTGYLSWIIKGIDWVTAHATSIEVANMSLAWYGYSSAAHTAIKNSVVKGVVYFAAAGNDSTDVYGPDGTFGTGDDICPAAFPEVAAISALNDTNGTWGGTGGASEYGNDDSLASFSNFSRSVVQGNPVVSPGMAIDLMCPGVNIYSTYKNGGYTAFSGTSMASPHAAGLAALHIAQYGRANDAAGVYAIRQALINGGVDQSGEYGLATQNDPDTFPEKLGWAGATEPVTDIAVTEISAPSSVVRGNTVSINVTVKNVGTEDVSGNIAVTLADNSDVIETKGITEGLKKGESITLTFVWDTTGAALGTHTLTASLENAEDEVAANNSSSATVMVTDQATPTSVHIADLDGKGTNVFGGIWVARVTFSVKNNMEQSVANATVSGTFSDGPTIFQCKTNGSGTCYVEGWQMYLNCLTFTVTNVAANLPYSPSENRDPEGDSNGTNIRVCRP
jgi:subtilisin family serine protease